LTFDSLETTVNQRYKAVDRDKASIPTEGFFLAIDCKIREEEKF
jgi:hypothetical protein